MGADRRSDTAPQNLMERAVVLGYGANQAVASPSLAALVNEYAAILASQVRRRHPMSKDFPGYCCRHGALVAFFGQRPILCRTRTEEFLGNQLPQPIRSPTSKPCRGTC